MTTVQTYQNSEPALKKCKKISYILEVCIPCSPLSFKGVYKILAITEVEFVHAVTAGGSVKFLPAV